MSATLALLSVVGGLVVVEGEVRCPTSAQVAAELAPLLPSVPAVAAPDRALLRRLARGLEVELRAPDGRQLGLRRVTAAASCADLAGAAAVVIATWEAELHPGSTSELTLPGPARKAPLGWEVGVGAGPSYDGVDPTGLLEVEAALGRPALMGRVALAAQLAPSEAPLGAGSVTWQRHRVSLGARYRMPVQRLRVDVHASMTLALLQIGGRGFATVHQEYDADPGLTFGVRLLLVFGRYAPWIDLSTTAWLRRQVALTEDPAPVATALPRFEGALSIGGLFGSRDNFE